MDSNSANLTQENKTIDTSLTSSEDEFIYLNGTKTKETMTSKMDLIPKMGKNKDVKISIKAEKGANDRFKDLFKNKNANIDNKKSNRWHFTDCFTSINKNCLTSIFNGLLLFLSSIAFILCLILLYCLFAWVIFGDKTINGKSVGKYIGKYWIVYAFIFIGNFFLAIYLFLCVLHKTLIDFQPDLANKKWFSTLFKIIPNLWMSVFFILFFLIIVTLFYLVFTSIIFDDIYADNRLFPAFCSLLSFICALIFYFSSLKQALMMFPFKMLF